MVISPFKVMPVPVIESAPEVIPATVTAPPLVMVKAFVPVFRALVAVIVPPPEVLLRIVSGSLKVYGVV